jgi:putative nucleotidyltransferase with HDIG domain
MEIIEDIIRKIEYFPDHPGAAYEIMAQIDRPGTTMDDIVNILEFDIAVTANILKFANSGTFGHCHDVNSLKQALECIGIDQLKKLITLSASTDIFASSPGHSGYETGLGELRRHSQAAAVISKHLLPYVPSDPDHQIAAGLFTACLLHDIGKIVLNRYVWEHDQKIKQLVSEKQYDFAEAEKAVIGMTHAEVGARILEKWHFPEQLITAVRHHHEPDTVPRHTMTHFVSLANSIAMIIGYATGIDAMGYKGFPELYRKYKLKEKDIEIISMSAVDEIKAIVPFERRKKTREVNKS